MKKTRNYTLLLLTATFLMTLSTLHAQSIIENSSFKFLDIPTSSRHFYLGKSAISAFEEDIDIVLANPALIQYNTKDKLLVHSSLYFTTYYTNIAYSLNYEVWDIPYIIGLQAISYGEQRGYSIDGQDLGNFYPFEGALYLAASKTYENYNFGTTIKLAYGNYNIASIAGISTDLSLLYRDEERNIFATLLVKNIGVQFMNSGTSNSSYPFDIQLGFSKKLKHMPFRFLVTAQNLYDWTNTTSSEDFGIFPLDPFYSNIDRGIFDNIMGHFIVGGEFYLGKSLRIGGSYDVRRGQEGTFSNFRGLTGFSLGAGMYTRKYNVGYSFSKISPVSVSHNFTVSLNMNEWLR